MICAERAADYASDEKREVWVDSTKVFAYILVVSGHFFHSMVKATIFPESDLYL